MSPFASAYEGSGARWSVAPASTFDHRAWDGETVVYVCDTGDTHALDPTTSLVLSTLLAAPSAELTAAAWLQRMVESDGADAEAIEADELQAFEAALVSLRKLGVVKATEPVVH